MTALNELLEEAVQRSTELAERATAAAASAAGLLEGASALGEMAVEEARTLHQEMADALAALGHARERVDTEADRAASVLEDLPARADAAEGAVRLLLSGVRQDAAHLGEVRLSLLTRMRESSEKADVELQELARRAQELQERLDARLQEAEDHVARLRSAVADGRTQLAAEQSTLREAISSLAVLGDEKAHGFADSLHALLVILGRNVVEFVNTLVPSHNEALQKLRTGFTDESPGAGAPDETWVEEKLKPLRDAVKELALLPAPAEEALSDPAAALFQQAESALTALEAIAVSLDHAAQSVPNAGGV